MSKYIPVDKLIAEIESLYDNMLKRIKIDKGNSDYWAGKADAYSNVIGIITSLQQEQPETPSGEEVMNMCNRILIDWVKEGKTPEEREQREQAHIRFFELYDEYMEQPDMDLEKEIESYLDGFIKTPTRTYFRDTIKHFYERGLNTRKD